MTETYCGIDPGLDGAVVVIRFENGQKNCMALTIPTMKLDKSKRDYTIPEMIATLRDCLREPKLGLPESPTMIALERSQSMPKQGVKSTFSTGRGYGLWEGILTTLKVPYITVRPSDWHRQICKGLPGDAKAKALKRVQTTLPNLNLLATPRCKKPHSGIVDAACLALYARHWWKCKEA